MPYYPQQGTPLLPALAGAAATYFDTQQQMKDAELQRQYEQQQMTQAAALAPLQQEYLKAQIGAEGAATKRDVAETGYTTWQQQQAQKESSIRLPPAIQHAMANASTPEAAASATARAANFYANSGFPELAKGMWDRVDALQGQIGVTGRDIAMENMRLAGIVAAIQGRGAEDIQVHQANRSFDVTHPLPSSTRRAGPTFSSVQSEFNTWKEGVHTQTGTFKDPTQPNAAPQPVYGKVPPPEADQDWVTNAINTIQNSDDPKAQSQSLINYWKKYAAAHKKPTAEVTRILTNAGKAAAAGDTSGGSDDTSGPQPDVPDSFQNP